MATIARPKIARTPPPRPAPADDFELRRFTVEEYHRLVEVGILQSGDPYELLDGWIVRKMPQNTPHVRTTNRFADRLRGLIANRWDLRTGNPITLESSEPEPDIVIAVGQPENYDDRHPSPNEIELLVEVSDATLDRDKRLKLPIYARAKIAVYCIVNIPERRVEVYTEPRGGKSAAYRDRKDYGIDDVLPLIVSGTLIGSIPVRGILPKPQR